MSANGDIAVGQILKLEYGASLPQAKRHGHRYPVLGSGGQVGLHDSFLVSGPGIVVGRKGSVGTIRWSDNSFWPIDTTYYVVPRITLNLRWCFWLLQRLSLEKLDSSTGVPGLNRNEVYSIRAWMPSPDEQRQIAQVIDGADASLQQRERLVDKLKRIRAGLQRDLLTRGLDDHGELRDPVTHPEQFKETPLGLLPREWAISTAETEFDILAGFTLGEHRKPRDHRHPYLRVANVQRGYITLDDVAELEASGDELTERLLEEDDLLVVEGHASPNEIGRCARVTEECTGMTFQNHLFRLRSKRLRPDFAERWLNSEWTVRYWRRQCGTSSGLNTINQTLLRQLNVVVPSPGEQEHIAQTCIAYDARIRAEEAHRDKLKRIKQGLMDDLLTGRVRV